MAVPRIAVTLPRPPTDQAQESANPYLDAIRKAGAEAVPVYPGMPSPADFDGLCLTGGGDLDPRRYGADADPRTAEVDPERDGVELALLEKALAADLPVLGICRGHQVLNVGFGGRLVQHVEGHRAPATHVVRVRERSRLAGAVGTAALGVNSRHHQAVTRSGLGRDLEVTAEHDGLVEAFESSAHRWVVGVQWHPERVDDAGLDPATFGVFRALVEEAAKT